MSEAPKRSRRPPAAAGSKRGLVKAGPRRRVRTILVGSLGCPVPPVVIARALEVARGMRDPRPRFVVFSLARILGTRFGLPHPGLRPNKLEIAEQQRYVEEAADELRRAGFDVKVAVGSARDFGKAIGWEATRRGASAVVVGDPMYAATRWERFVKGDDANRVGRFTQARVHVVPIAPVTKPRRSGARPAVEP